MRELILVRHGQSDQYARNITGGWTDTRLTDLGRRQARDTAARLAEILSGRTVQLLTSDLQRAADTAECIGSALRVRPQMHPALRESNNGRAAGLTREAAKAIEHPVTQPTLDWVPYPGAESWRMMAERVFHFLDSLQADPAETVLLISHGNTGVAIIHWWLQLCPACRKVSFELAHCSITRLTVNEWGERTIATLNDTAHLDR